MTWFGKRRELPIGTGVRQGKAEGVLGGVCTLEYKHAASAE